MKLDNDHPNFHPTPQRKSYNPFESVDETFDSPGLNDANLLLKEDGNGFFDLKAFEKNSNTKSLNLDNGDFLWEQVMPGHPAVDSHEVSANIANGGHGPVFVREGQPYTDKDVTECELPEFNVECCKESNSQSVKDISVDDGMPSHVKVWLQSKEESSKGSCRLPVLDTQRNDGSEIKSKNNLNEVSDLELSKSTLPRDWKKGEGSKGLDGYNNPFIIGQYMVDADMVKVSELKLESDDSTSLSGWSATGAETTTGALVCDSEENLMYNSTVPEKCASKQVEPDLTSVNGLLSHGVVEQKTAFGDKSDQNNLVTDESAKTNSFPKFSADPVQVEVKQEGSADPVQVKVTQELQVPKQQEEIMDQSPNLSIFLVQETTERNSGSSQSRISSDNRLESATITLGSENSSSGMGKEEEDGGKTTQNPECSKHVEVRQVDGGSPSTSSNAGLAGIFERRVLGETSFSYQAAPPPSSITFMGPVSYSGSVSLRSESSAGSTRSFAFPVLQTEWNSSPVRMAKADRRRPKKLRGWVHAVICCRF